MCTGPPAPKLCATAPIYMECITNTISPTRIMCRRNAMRAHYTRNTHKHNHISHTHCVRAYFGSVPTPQLQHGAFRRPNNVRAHATRLRKLSERLFTHPRTLSLSPFHRPPDHLLVTASWAQALACADISLAPAPNTRPDGARTLR